MMPSLFKNRIGLHRVLWGIIAAASLWLRCGIPLFAMANAGDDDALFVRLAQSLAQGRWLGHYDNVTLAKGMFYPLFIAVSSFLCLPLKLAEQAVYLLVSALTARFVARQTNLPWLGTLLFALLAFNPILWGVSLARVIREGLYISLSCAVVVLTTMVVFSPLALRRRLWLAAGAGLMLGAFWLTREEGPWILPAMLVVAVLGSGWFWRRGDRPQLRALGACCVLFLLCFAGLNNLVAAINQRSYGVYETVEFKSLNFVRAYSALAGIESRDWQPKVVLPRYAREAAYAASPAARELEPYLDGAGGEAWRVNSCGQGVLREQCPEILAGWFMWALRDAVAAAGHATTAKTADAFYGQLADELEAACAEGKLACVQRRPSLAPPFKARYLREALQPARSLLEIVFTLGGGLGNPVPNTGTPGQMDNFVDLTGVAPVSADVTMHEVAGWVGAKNGVPAFVVRSPPGTMMLWQSITAPGPLATLHPDWSMAWFDLSFICAQECTLAIIASDGTAMTIPLADLKTGLTQQEADKAIHFERVKTRSHLPLTAARQRLQRRIAVFLSQVYRVVIPPAALLALIGLGIATVLRRGPAIEIYALAAASLAAITCRIALLAYLDVTSIPSNNDLYASPAMPFVLIFVVTGIYAGWASISARQRPVPPP